MRDFPVSQKHKPKETRGKRKLTHVPTATLPTTFFALEQRLAPLEGITTQRHASCGANARARSLLFIERDRHAPRARVLVEGDSEGLPANASGVWRDGKRLQGVDGPCFDIDCARGRVGVAWNVLRGRRRRRRRRGRLRVVVLG